MLGGKVLIPLAATHWAVKVGDTWYEVPGASKSDSSSPNKIQRSNGLKARSGAHPIGGGLVGTTSKSDNQIDTFCRKWVSANPVYHFTTTNCQKFATDFADFLCDGAADMPSVMEAGIRGRGVGPRATSGAANGTAFARASVGRSQALHGIAAAAAEGPAASARAVCGREGFGAFADAQLGKAEARLGGNVGLHVGLSARTGAGVANGKAEVSLLGFGVSAGQSGVGISTPVGGAQCAIQ